jgi:hypothetical protein
MPERNVLNCVHRIGGNGPAIRVKGYGAAIYASDDSVYLVVYLQFCEISTHSFSHNVDVLAAAQYTLRKIPTIRRSILRALRQART